MPDILTPALGESVTEATIAYLIAPIDAGAEVLQLFDTWAGSVPAPLFERAVIQPAAQIVKAIKAHAPHVPVIGFPRAAAPHLAAYAARTGVDGVGIDHMTPLSFAAGAVTPDKALQGNLDPMRVVAGGKALDEGIDAILQALGNGPLIFNLGHGITPQADPENVTRLVARVRGEKR